MLTDNCSNNRKLAKNTLLLYIRTILIMATTLYTSRVVLDVLGIEDYGIYDIVGGTIAMFGILTNSLANAISRFITFELGKGDKQKLNRIFYTSVNILLFFAVIIVLIGEILGVWFLNHKMNIPTERIVAANWVFQGTLITFCVNLLSVPYNAAIIAHEEMKAFASISLIEVFLKLSAVSILYITSGDNLIIYAISLVLVSMIIRLIYGVYCCKRFEESHYSFRYDRNVAKEMSGFAGWNFLTCGIYLLNTQGVNLLINIFFGVSVNAARGIATQVDSAVSKFVTDFSTAINPQILKSYARQDLSRLHSLVCKGAKVTYFLMFCISLPLICETDYILHLWLTNVPEHTAIFVRLAIIGTLIDKIGYTLMNANVATGKIRKYAIYISLVASLVFIMTWIAFSQGAPAETTYISFIVVYSIINMMRLYIVKDMINISPFLYLKNVIIPIIYVTLLAAPVPCLLMHYVSQSLERLLLTVFVSVLCTAISIYFVGLDKVEKKWFFNKMIELYNKHF